MKQTAAPRTLTTPQADTLGPAAPWQDYPRPQLVRGEWINLNGRWEFGTGPETHGLPGEEVYAHQILVPFPPESALSGIGRRREKQTDLLYYRRRFVLPALPSDRYLLLHCPGIDQEAEVYCNGSPVGRLAPVLDGPAPLWLPDPRQGDNELVLAVRDRLDRKAWPWGKQRQKDGGMWYSPVSGIWQTVWLEWVPREFVTRVKLTPSLTDARVEVFTARVGETPLWPGQPAETGSLEFAGSTLALDRGVGTLTPAEPRLWTPEDPWLYRFAIRCGQDRVESYFGLRTVGTGRVNGVPRLLLNGRPHFFHGLLDQGWWPDGLWTPASPECWDKELTDVKALGFDTLRKHIKVEPELFYYACDRLGVLVFQDLINSGSYSFLRDTALPTAGVQRLPHLFRLPHPRQRALFRRHMASTVAQLSGHPSVVYWTVFNEGWGQHQTRQCYRAMKALDPHRIIDTTSGWFRVGPSDVESRHVYFRPFRLPKSRRPVVLSEFGGYVWKSPAHSRYPDKTYGYKLFDRQEDYQTALLALYTQQILPAVGRGLCGAVYTQVSDVEEETNGLFTYDRRLCKVEPRAMAELGRALRQAAER